MPDDLPIEVLTELGRVTWAAIKLEDYAEDVCSRIDPVDPRTDRRLIGRKIKDAKRILAGSPTSAARDDARAWLEHASEAIERRNAVLHATPLVLIGPGQRSEWPQFLGEMPRQGRAYFERPLTVESLSELRSVLEEAASGWRDLVIALETESRQRQAR